MSKLNMKEWINEIIQKKEVVAMPIMTHPGIEMIGKTVRDAVTDGQVHYNAIKALSEKYPTAAATVIMDLTVEAEAFGAEIVFPENEVPSVVGRLLANEEDIEKLGDLVKYLYAVFDSIELDKNEGNYAVAYWDFLFLGTSFLLGMENGLNSTFVNQCIEQIDKLENIEWRDKNESTNQ